MTIAKPPLHQNDKIKELVNATTRMNGPSIFCNDEAHVTLMDEAKQRLHAVDDSRLLPDVTQTGS